MIVNHEISADERPENESGPRAFVKNFKWLWFFADSQKIVLQLYLFGINYAIADCHSDHVIYADLCENHSLINKRR